MSSSSAQAFGDSALRRPVARRAKPLRATPITDDAETSRPGAEVTDAPAAPEPHEIAEPYGEPTSGEQVLFGGPLPELDGPAEPLPIEIAAAAAVAAAALNGGRDAAPHQDEQLPAATASADVADANPVNDVHHVLARAARLCSPELGGTDMDAAVNAGLVRYGAGEATAAVEIAAVMGELVAAMAPTTALTFTQSWEPFGQLIPVLSGGTKTGASVLAAALTDALQEEGQCTLLVDAADPSSSGLGLAGTPNDPWRTVHHPHARLQVHYTWRYKAMLAHLGTRLPTMSPGMLPPPTTWLLEELRPLHATVVDIGWPGRHAVADPFTGAGGWLHAGTPTQHVLLAVRATQPSLREAERVLTDLARWVQLGHSTAACRLVVMAATCWPRGVLDAAGPYLEALLADAVFVPHDPAVEAFGVTAARTPPALRDAVRPLLAAWGLAAPQPPQPRAIAPPPPPSFPPPASPPAGLPMTWQPRLGEPGPVRPGSKRGRWPRT